MELSVEGPAEVDIEPPQDTDTLIFTNYLIDSLANVTHHAGKVVFPVYAREDLF